MTRTVSWPLVVAALLALALSAGCTRRRGGGGTIPDSGRPPTDARTLPGDTGPAGCPGGCPTGSTCMGSTCVPSGGCAPSCTAGRTCCGSLCTDTLVDSANCGVCGRGCSPGVPCVGGSCSPGGGCVPPCGPGSTCMGSICVPTGGDCGLDAPFARMLTPFAGPAPCSAATRSCVAACTTSACVSSCNTADPNPDCSRCYVFNQFSCVNSLGCQAQWTAMACCVNTTCPSDPMLACLMTTCASLDTAYNTCGNTVVSMCGAQVMACYP